MTHWIRSAVRRMKDRRAQSAPATARGGSSRKKMSGVSTVEYALILVAVVAIVAGAAVVLDAEFEGLLDTLATEIEAAEDQVEVLDDAG